MNQRVEEMVNELFFGVHETEETRNFRDEVLQNCQEHYDDLILQGMGEEEALHEVSESMRGMEEVLDPYREAPDAAFQKVVDALDDMEETFSGVWKEKDARKASDFPQDTLSGEDIEAIHVSVLSTDLLISTSEDQMIHIHNTDRTQGESFTTECKGGTLYIRETPPARSNPGEQSLMSLLTDALSFFSGNTSELELEIPAPWRKTLHVTTGAGDIQLKGHILREVQVVSTSGDLSVTNDAVVEKMHFKSTSGDMHFNGRAEELHAQSVSGDVTLQGECIEADASTSSGDLTLDLERDSMKSLRFHSSSGDLTFTGSTESASMETSSGDITVRGRAERLVISSRSGDLHLVGSSSFVQAETTSGDITLDLDVITDVQFDGNLSSTSGDIHVLLPDNVQSVQCTTSSTSGDCITRKGTSSDAAVRIQATTRSGDIVIQ
ncbi:MAG: DUF4097 family beta strand repeat protein [Clostridia bacterium]|nr:DUF4097 family beta strand repeat protein [Clostridia bacterium]